MGLNRTSALRIAYALIFVAILAVEVLIAVFVRDNFVRPYVGDMLVTVLICCFMRIFFVSGALFLPLWVFLFATAVEIGQYFDIVHLMGLENCTFLSVAIGNTFSAADLLCYAVGCLFFFIAEQLLRKNNRAFMLNNPKENNHEQR